MRRSAVVLTLLSALAPAIAAAQESVPPPPGVLRPPSPSRPEPTPAATSPAIDEERLASIVDAAVERAMARRHPAQSPVVGWTPPQASPQAWAQAPPAAAPQYRIVRAEPARRIGYVPTVGEDRQYVDVLVPACWPRRAVGALGERLVECGRPAVRRMRVAPAEVVQCAAPRAAAVARPVYASGQGTD